jgi:GNAT superfamily N-acetyltransferase
MFQLLTPSNYPKVIPLFQPLDEHMAIASALAGKSSAQVYANSSDRPQAAFIWMRYRVFLSCLIENPEIAGDLCRLFQEEIVPRQLEARRDVFILYYAPQGWEERFDSFFSGAALTRYWRQYYRFKESQLDWRSLLPGGFELYPVDMDLLSRPGLKNLDELKEEMCSERDTVAEFLEKSFGVCLVHDGELVGWCLSEYNLDGGCEIGIAVGEAYRRRGLATLMTAAFVEEAHRRGIKQIGWDCWKENRPSGATAIKAGFECVKEYPVFVVKLMKLTTDYETD